MRMVVVDPIMSVNPMSNRRRMEFMATFLVGKRGVYIHASDIRQNREANQR